MSYGDRANYFYSVRVTDESVHKKIEEALGWILDKDSQYENFCYTKEMLHVTLCEVSLQTPDEISVASQVLSDYRDTLKRITPTTPLVLRGISHFRHTVMYGQVEHGKDFRTFAEFLSTKAEEAGVRVIENHDEFIPHMTILKVSGAKARKAKVDKLNPWLFVNLKDTLFGKQDVRSVHLCKMGSDRRDDGFYVTPAEITL